MFRGQSQDYSQGGRQDARGSVMVIRDNPLQLEVNKVLWIERALFLLSLRCRGAQIRLIYKSPRSCCEHKREKLDGTVAPTG